MLRLLLITYLLVGLATPAQAYIDPNAGGLLFQLLAPLFAAVVGVWLFLKRSIKDWVLRVWARLTGKRSQ